MNSLVKSLFFGAIAFGLLFAGLHFQRDRELKKLQQDYETLASRAAELARETALAKANLEAAQAVNSSGADFETNHNASVANIAVEQKKIDELLDQWPKVDAERAAAVEEVRKRESDKAPYTLTLTDGSQLENFVVKSVPDDNTVSVEHSSGVVKIAADKLPEDLRTRLGLGWRPEPPPGMSIDKDGNAVIKQAVRLADEKKATDDAARELGMEAPDTSTMAGVSRAIVVIEARLKKAQEAFDAERANIRKLAIFKPNLKPVGSTKTYAVLSKEANQRLAGLAGQVQALRAERNNLQYKLKSM